MRLRGIYFPAVCNASGARGFFGEGYPFHVIWKSMGLTFKGCGFGAKTTTMEERLKPDEGKGNMRLKSDGITPAQWFPDCIVVNFRPPWVLNAVGLSGPGAPSLFARGFWQRMKEPFFISFMSVQGTAADRLSELTDFVSLAKREMNDCASQWGLEINFSCPNLGLAPDELVNETGASFDIAGRLGVPLQAKFSPTVPVESAAAACQHPECDALTVGNTVKWSDVPDDVKVSLCGSFISPLAKYGGGGLSSPTVVPTVCRWIREARDLGFQKPIWAGNGLYSLPLVRDVVLAGASGVQLGCVGILRPWRMRNMIRFAGELLSS